MKHKGRYPIYVLGSSRVRESQFCALSSSKLDGLPKHVRETTRVPLGTYRGLRFGMVLHPQFPPDVFLEGSMTRSTMLSREHQGPRAVLNALDRLATGYGSDCDRVRQDFSIAEAQLRDYKSRLGKPFTLEAYLTELTSLRDQLKAGLSGAGHETGKDEGPSVSDIAGRIKALKAANSVEATPQRVRQKQSTAEEPITARIRRRAESIPASGSATQADAIPVAGIIQQSPMTFQERLALERQNKSDGPSPL